VVNRPVPLAGDAALLAAFARSLVRVGPSKLGPADRELARAQLIELTEKALRGTVRRKAEADRELRRNWIALQLAFIPYTLDKIDRLSYQLRDLLLHAAREAGDGEDHLDQGRIFDHD